MADTSSSATDATQRRREAARRRHRRIQRHRLRLVDDIIHRLWGRVHRPPTPPRSHRPLPPAALTEGGNIFKTTAGAPATQRINQPDIAPTIAWLETLTGLDFSQPRSTVDGLSMAWLGSTGRTPSSGDLDLMVDDRTTSKAQLIARLTAWAKTQNMDPTEVIKKSGISVHFLTPIRGDAARGFVQTDFMFTPHPVWTAFVLQAAPRSRFKGKYRNMLLFSLAKFLGYKVDQNRGLIRREGEQVLTTDPLTALRMLLGPTATLADGASVESLLAAIADDADYDAKVANFQAVLAQDGLSMPTP